MINNEPNKIDDICLLDLTSNRVLRLDEIGLLFDLEMQFSSNILDTTDYNLVRYV